MKEKFKVLAKEYHTETKTIIPLITHYFITEKEARDYIIIMMELDKMDKGVFDFCDNATETEPPQSADEVFYELTMKMPYGEKRYEIADTEY